MTEELDNWITTTEAAERLGVTSRWITRLINRGDLQGRKMNSRLFLVYAPDVDAYRYKMKKKSPVKGKKSAS
jgi:excisionase family DNA binding protein